MVSELRSSVRVRVSLHSFAIVRTLNMGSGMGSAEPKNNKPLTHKVFFAWGLGHPVRHALTN